MENITYAEAKRKVNITTPKPTTSYSAAVQKSSEMNIQQIISTIIPHIETAVRNVISCSTSKCDHFKAPSSGLIFRRDRSDSVSTNLSAASEKRKKPGDSTTDDDSSALDPNSNPTKNGAGLKGLPQKSFDPEAKITPMQDLVRQWKAKPLHGRYRSRIEDNAIDTKASQGWLQSGNLFLETEGFIASIQDQVVPTKCTESV
ncbi:unnamed protein product [Acanthoscelides obtectus]|uniref:Uncharacterized protein n=1 Tax=Acanthoscelides obtectus TaxID=200917 RepID=A0A9P0VQF1_ACAOB|nr:unnamed protein product [Acanthoscelides obtectus]CAK1685546.1 hypothetical protein AOBTE_LOCUS35498 [Acanthoscelides obtectus]